MEIRLEDGTIINCDDKPMDSGAQGEIFKTKDGHGVVKLYFNPSTIQKKVLVAITKHYNPVKDDEYWKQYFCWPTAVVTQPRLGLLMPRAQASLKRLDWFLLPKARRSLPVEERGNWMGQVKIALRLSRAMRRLHHFGLCHSDLSYRNCLVDPTTGELKLIDLDGLVVPGILPPSVSGTKGFMAPEILSSGAFPSITTDLHSLAVIIYQLLLFRHPLQGPKVHSAEVEEDERLAFGREALFIEHPTDHSNRPKGNFPTSVLLGVDLQRLMQRAFVKGLHDPSSRPQATSWEADLIRLVDRIVPCVNRKCELAFFSFIETSKHPSCPWCGTPWKAIQRFALLDLYRPVSGMRGQYVLDGYKIVAYPDRHLYDWHLYPSNPPSVETDPTPKATLSYDAKKQAWTMTNRSGNRFKVFDEDKPPRDIKTGECFSLVQNQRVILGEQEGVRMALVRLGKLK